MQKDDIRRSLISAAVKNMKEFGYGYADKDNILTDDVYSKFFVSMLKENRGHTEAIDAVIDELLAECGGPKTGPFGAAIDSLLDELVEDGKNPKKETP